MHRPDLETLRAYQLRQFQTAMDVLRSLPSTSAIFDAKNACLPWQILEVRTFDTTFDATIVLRL